MAPKKRILVVDDETDVVEIIRVVLSTKGYEVLPTYNGEDGWAALIAERPDLVITDLRMPGMSGMEFIKRVRANPDIASTPILVISSLGATTDKTDDFWAMGLKSDDFLSKPFDPLGLLGRVEYLLRKDSYLSEQKISQAASQNGTAQTPVPTSTHENNEAASAAVKSDDPADVVRAFVEAWNRQDFNTEYDTLGDEMLGGLDRREYVQRRIQFFADDAGETRHEVVDAETLKSSNLVATVACLRDDAVHGVSHRKDERYTLKKNPAGWKIVNVRSRAMAFAVD